MAEEKHESHGTLRVGVSMIPPMVSKVGDRFDGFEIALWESIAKELDVTTEYVSQTFTQLLASLQGGSLDVGIAAISMTEEREKLLDFTHATFNSGLHILVPKRMRSGLFVVARSVFNKEIGKILVFLFGFLLLAAHLMWFAERNGGGSLGGPYIPGIGNALWWALVTVSTIGYGDYTPVTLLGRVCGSLTILSGLAIFGFYIAQMSSTLTLRRLHSDITHHDDLRGKHIATVSGTHAEEVLKKYGARILAAGEITGAYRMLDEGLVDAVVFDAPVLAHYADNEGRAKVVIVGGLFERQDYAFALQNESAYRERINQVLLHLHESGVYNRLYREWFGDEG